MRWGALFLGLVGVIALLWLAGERHRSSCIDAGKVSCSVLPWDGGERPPSSSGNKYEDLLNDNPYEDLLDEAVEGVTP